MNAVDATLPMPDGPGRIAKGSRCAADGFGAVAQGRPSSAAQRVKSTLNEPLPTVTVAQVVAAQLRLQASALIKQAEQLEATVPRPPKRPKDTRTAKQMCKEMGLNV